MKKRISTALRLTACLSLFLTLRAVFCAISASDVVEAISVSQKCSLTATYAYSGDAFSDQPVSLYKIADLSSDYRYTLTDDFQATHLQLNGISSVGEWDAIRTTLEAYVTANRIEAAMVQSTDANGRAFFQNLTPGLYMVASAQRFKDDVRYDFASALVVAPDLNEDGSWNYDVNVKPKGVADNFTGEKTEYKVLKLWKDAGKSSERPDSVEAYILRNGEIVDVAILSDANNWSYVWDAEDDGGVWQAVEKNVPDGYVMTVEKHATTFVIINSIADEPDTTPDKPDEPDTTPDEPDTPPDKPDTPKNPDAPQTGDTVRIELYVMALCVSGIALVLLGISGKRRTE